MSVQNPYSDVNIPTYFANEAFEPEESSRYNADANLEKIPTNFLHSGAANSTQQNWDSAKSQPALVPNPYGSVYRSPPAGSSKQLGTPEEDNRLCHCCKLCKCCHCCYSCIIS